MRDLVSVLRDFMVSADVDGTVVDTEATDDVLVLPLISHVFDTDDTLDDGVVLLVLLILNTVSEDDD